MDIIEVFLNYPFGTKLALIALAVILIKGINMGEGKKGGGGGGSSSGGSSSTPPPKN